MFGEDLSEFEDYLKEFESSVFFDSEVCPTCGINLSDSIIPVSAAFVQIEFNSEKERNNALHRIKNSGIIVRENNNMENVNGRMLLIPESKVNDVQKLLEKSEGDGKN